MEPFLRDGVDANGGLRLPREHGLSVTPASDTFYLTVAAASSGRGHSTPSIDLA